MKQSSKRDRMRQRLNNPRNTTARFYDNGGASADRYTAVYCQPVVTHGDRYYDYRGMSAYPYDPQGVGISGISNHMPADTCHGKPVPRMGQIGHLGKRIPFNELPWDCQQLVLQDLCPA